MECSEDFMPRYIHVYIHFDDNIFHYWMEQEEDWDWMDKMTVEEFLKEEYNENIKTGKYTDYIVKPSKKIIEMFEYLLKNMDKTDIFAEFGKHTSSMKRVTKDKVLKDIDFQCLKTKKTLEKFIFIYTKQGCFPKIQS